MIHPILYFYNFWWVKIQWNVEKYSKKCDFKTSVLRLSRSCSGVGSVNQKVLPFCPSFYHFSQFNAYWWSTFSEIGHFPFFSSARVCFQLWRGASPSLSYLLEQLTQVRLSQVFFGIETAKCYFKYVWYTLYTPVLLTDWQLELNHFSVLWCLRTERRSLIQGGPTIVIYSGFIVIITLGSKLSSFEVSLWGCLRCHCDHHKHH